MLKTTNNKLPVSLKLILFFATEKHSSPYQLLYYVSCESNSISEIKITPIKLFNTLFISELSGLWTSMIPTQGVPSWCNG